MSTYPAPGWRNGGATAGDPRLSGGDTATLGGMAAAGFLAPGAAEAMRRAGQRIPTTPPVPPPNPGPHAAATARAGVQRGAARLFWPIAAVTATYGLYSWLVEREAGWNLNGWTVELDCGRSRDYLTTAAGIPSCDYSGLQTLRTLGTRSETATVAYFWQDNGPYANIFNPDPGEPGHIRMVEPAATLVRDGAAELPVYQPATTDVLAMPVPGRVGRPSVAPLIDPMSVPPDAPMPEPARLPYRLLPLRVPNPYRNPHEQPSRGNEIPAPSREPEIAPHQAPRPGHPQPYTPRPPLPDTDVPGWVGNPAPAPYAPGLTATVEPPPTPGAGPTIVVGPPGTPPVGPHVQEPPGRNRKERKGRTRSGAALVFLKKYTNKATEAYDVVECVWKGLPKKLRWDATRQKWWDHKAAMQAQGKRPTKRPDGIEWDKGENKDFGKVALPVLSLKNSSGDAYSAQDFMAGNAPRITAGNEMVTTPLRRTPKEPAHHDPTRYPGMTATDKIALIYQHADKLNLDAIFKCLQANEVEDAMIGRVGQQLGKMGRITGQSHGFGTGPTF